MTDVTYNVVAHPSAVRAFEAQMARERDRLVNGVDALSARFEAVFPDEFETDKELAYASLVGVRKYLDNLDFSDRGAAEALVDAADQIERIAKLVQSIMQRKRGVPME